jgi:hypothetical protein
MIPVFTYTIVLKGKVDKSMLTGPTIGFLIEEGRALIVPDGRPYKKAPDDTIAFTVHTDRRPDWDELSVAELCDWGETKKVYGDVKTFVSCIETDPGTRFHSYHIWPDL